MLDRDAVEEKYSVLEHMPTAMATEELTWATNIFVASDLTEYRVPLAEYPAIRVTYNFNVRNVNRTLFTEIMEKEATWMLPYLPHLTNAGIVNDEAVPTTIDSVTYPPAEYYLVFSRGHLVYRKATDMDVSAFEGITDAVQVWVVPCYEAVIEPRLSWMDVGKCRDGSTMSLVFRMKGDSEKALTFKYDNPDEPFDFIDSLQTPLQVEAARHQRNFAPTPSGIYTYKPRARMPDEATTVQCRYLLEYSGFIREDYPFKGTFMAGRGPFTADNYVNEDELHRLEDDRVVIEYQQGIAIANVLMRKVAA